MKNRTGRIINITAKFGQGQPNLCDVWNWDGGRKVARCKQETRGNGTFGGIGTGYDVDAFTFANNGYHVRLYRLGAWQWITKGVWTKISSDKIADCGIGDNNEVWCTVLEQ